MSVFREETENFDKKSLIILVLLVFIWLFMYGGDKIYNDISCVSDIHGEICE